MPGDPGFEQLGVDRAHVRQGLQGLLGDEPGRQGSAHRDRAGQHLVAGAPEDERPADVGDERDELRVQVGDRGRPPPALAQLPGVLDKPAIRLVDGPAAPQLVAPREVLLERGHGAAEIVARSIEGAHAQVELADGQGENHRDQADDHRGEFRHEDDHHHNPHGEAAQVGDESEQLLPHESEDGVKVVDHPGGHLARQLAVVEVDAEFGEPVEDATPQQVADRLGDLHRQNPHEVAADREHDPDDDHGKPDPIDGARFAVHSRVGGLGEENLGTEPGQGVDHQQNEHGEEGEQGDPHQPPHPGHGVHPAFGVGDDGILVGHLERVDHFHQLRHSRGANRLLGGRSGGRWGRRSGAAELHHGVGHRGGTGAPGDHHDRGLGQELGNPPDDLHLVGGVDG